MVKRPSVRVIAYVDGFNLYFGLRDSGYKRYYWLNIKAMVQKLIRPHQQLLMTKYFTAREEKGSEEKGSGAFLKTLARENHYDVL